MNPEFKKLLCKLLVASHGKLTPLVTVTGLSIPLLLKMLARYDIKYEDYIKKS